MWIRSRFRSFVKRRPMPRKKSSALIWNVAGLARFRRRIDRERCGSVQGLAQAMIALQGAIQVRLDRLGFRGESRRYVPHLTLGRAGRNSQPRALVRELAALSEIELGSMLVDEVTVFSSELKPDGPVYDVLAHAALAR